MPDKGETFKWTQEHSKVFQGMKVTVVKDVIFMYPNFKELFVLHTYAVSNFESSVLEGKAVGIVLYKFNPAQSKCTVKICVKYCGDFELFSTILLGNRVIMITNDKHLTYTTENLIIVEYWDNVC